MSIHSRVSPSPSSSRSPWKHEVFLSFHGKDTRNGFTDHLYAALKQKGISAFRDDEKLERGKYISHELLKAIEESIFAIVIISANYASSKWCLVELAEIIRCTRETGLTVLPIFYHVDPSDLRKKKRTFSEAFGEHEKDPEVDMAKLQIWRSALTEVSNISGWHVHDRHESAVIQEITRSMLNGLNRNSSAVSNELVGIDSRAEEMMNSLALELDDVRFVGICGMGGVGKTTLAEVIYDRISYMFDASSFIGCIREETNSRGLVSLQKQLISEILMDGEINIWDVRGGMNVIRNRLPNKSVLIVLDDVDTDKQLEALAGSHKWFGRRSRIIITTRDNHLLERHGANSIYTVKELNNDEALHLFSLSAFKKSHPAENYVELSNCFINYAQGLPLALKVLGSSLFGRHRNVWKSAWDQLQGNPKSEILCILQIGFDGLEDLQKKLFLDIVCFFKGEILDNILDILKSFGYHPEYNINVLMEKSLITISCGRLKMHDLLQKMGQEIVRHEAPEEPGRRSRLWRCEDVIHVLKNNSGTNMVEGIVLNLPTQKKERLSIEAFLKMKKLRILKISNTSIIRKFPKFCEELHGVEWYGDPSKFMLSNELRLIEWYGYPSKSLVASFQSDNLIELSMPYSNIERLWKGIESLVSLKRFDLSKSERLIETPDFTKVPNLETLHLEGCTSLSKVHVSIFHLKRLKSLNLSACTCLESLPDKIGLESLERFYLSGCSRLEKLPDSLGNMISLRLLYLNGTFIKELPFSIERLSSLSILSLQDCRNLSTLPSVLGGLSGLSSLKVLELPCSRFRDMDSGEGLFWKHLSRRITIKFSNDISVPLLLQKTIHPSTLAPLPRSTLEPLPRFHRNIVVTAFYISFDSRLYGIKNWNVVTAKLLASRSVCKVIYGSSVVSRIPDGFNNKSFGNKSFFCSRSSFCSVTLEMHPDLDNKRKVKGYAMFIVYESCSFLSRSDFYLYFKADGDRPARRLFLSLGAEVFSPLGSIWVYIPANWFLVRGKNMDALSYLKVIVASNTTGVKVKECGVRLVQQHDAMEFYDSITSVYPMGSMDSELLHHLSCYSEMGCCGAEPL